MVSVYILYFTGYALYLLCIIIYYYYSYIVYVYLLYQGFDIAEHRLIK